LEGKSQTAPNAANTDLRRSPKKAR
jgi:hypothetical protein